jgi:hypothetical protein
MERIAVMVVGLLAAMAGAWVVVVLAMMRVASRADARDEELRREPVPRWVWDSSEEPWSPPPM